MSIVSEIERIQQNVQDTYNVLQEAGADMPETQNTDNLAGTAASISAVLYGKAQSLTAAQQNQAKANIGLGNVPNVATNDQTPTYTEATTLEKLTSGEKLSAAFVKIAKGITDLISHIGNKENPHGVTISQIGAAPSGYGLGDQCKSIDDWNNATLTGWYKSNVNTPTGSAMFGQAILYSPGTILQKAYAHNNGIYLEAHRECVSGTWGEWEWVNPPMIPGVEYRTTERYNGKAVYTKSINFGTLPNNAYASVETGIDRRNIISVDGVIKSDNFTRPLPLIDGDGTVHLSWWASSYDMHIRTLTDMSDSVAIATLKYVKDY